MYLKVFAFFSISHERLWWKDDIQHMQFWHEMQTKNLIGKGFMKYWDSLMAQICMW